MAGKKKRGHPDLEEVVARPWCYYCERDFDDLKILISHQKAKHFKCERCGRRLNTAGGLSVHMNQVHKETLTSVDNALGNRASLDVEIFGMEGIPDDVVQAHNQRIIAQFYQAEADRRAATGNRGPGNGAGGPSKKPKFESPAELKKRLAEHKARMAEQAGGGVSSGANTPGGGIPNGQSPAPALSPPFANSPYAPPQVPYSAPPGASYGSFSQEPYAQPVPAYQQPYTQQPGFAPPVSQYPSQQPPYSGAPTYPPQPAFSPAGYQQPPPNFPAAPPHFAAGTPPGYNPYQPPSYAPQIGSLPSRPPSLPQAPGLPQRPSFGAPPTAPFPAQHQGAPQQGGWGASGWNAPDYQNPAISSGYPPDNQAGNGTPGAAREPDDIDELIRMAEAGIKPPKKSETPPAPVAVSTIPKVPAPAPEQAPTPAVPSVTATPEVSEKKPKKDKEKATKMVYADNEVSPEEKMAKLSRYAFVPEKKEETVLVDANQAPGVAGTIRE